VLSRSSGRESIRLLCDFDDKLFMASHNLALVDENERLENLNIETKLWYERMVEIDAIRAHIKVKYIVHTFLKIGTIGEGLWNRTTKETL
jgi:hypothetical protein